MSMAGKILLMDSSVLGLPPYEYQYSHGKTDIYACGPQYPTGKLMSRDSSVLLFPPMNISIPMVQLTFGLVDLSIPTGKLMSRAGKILLTGSSVFPPYEYQYSHGTTDIRACGPQYPKGKTNVRGGEYFCLRTVRC